MSKSGCPNVLVPTRTQIFPPCAYQPSVSGGGPARFQQLAFLPKIRDDLKENPLENIADPTDADIRL